MHVLVILNLHDLQYETNLTKIKMGASKVNTVANEWLSRFNDDDVANNLPLQLHCALTNGVVVAACCPATHHHVATWSAHLLPDLRRLAALSLTTECQDHSRK